MKKIISLFFGCLAAIFVSVSFSACNPKDQNNASDYSLVGMWKWVYEEYDYTYTLTIKKNNTGNTGEILVMRFEQEEVGQCTFAWRYTSENTITLVIESGQIPGLGGQGAKIDLTFEFYGPDKVLFTMVDSPNESFGPFNRISGGNNGGNDYAGLSNFEQRLVGTWTWTMNGTILNTLIINADHTGRVVSLNFITQQNTQATFNWSVVSENVVRLNITSGQLIGLGEVPNPLILNVSFPANNQVLFTMASNPSISFGPFTKQ